LKPYTIRLPKKNPQLKSVGLEAFTNQLKDDNNLNTLYNKLSTKNPQLKDVGFDGFKTQLFGGIAKPEAQPVAETPDVEQAAFDVLPTSVKMANAALGTIEKISLVREY
jgi:hypothetical protein